jgi:septum formation protein
VKSADLDETPRPGEAPKQYVNRLAQEKAAAVAALEPGALVLAADTSVVIDSEILGKPGDPAHATQMLRRLSGRAHSVLTGIALAGVHAASRVVETIVHFRSLSEAEIAWYIGTREGIDKAGAYAVQGIGGLWVRKLEGSPSNVVGLPLAELAELLAEARFPLRWSSR